MGVSAGSLVAFALSDLVGTGTSPGTGSSSERQEKERSIKKKMSGHKKQLLGGIVLSLPSMLIVAVFFLLPMLFTLGLSFTDWNGIGLDGCFVGFSSYVVVPS